MTALAKANVLPMHQLTVQQMDPRTLNPAVFNPPMRTTPGALAGLTKGIIESGQILVPLHVMDQPDKGWDNVIVDGHRRHAVAIEIGLETVPVIVHTSGAPQDLWAQMSQSNRKVNGLEWLYFHVHSRTPQSKIPRTYRNDIQGCIGMWGSARKALDALTANGTTTNPHIHAQACALISLCCGIDKGRAMPKLVVIAEWMMRHHSQGTWHQWVNSGRSKSGRARTLLARINADKPLPNR